MLKFIRNLFGSQGSGEASSTAQGDESGTARPPALPGVRITSFATLHGSHGSFRPLEDASRRETASGLTALSLAAHGSTAPPGGSWASIVLEGSLTAPFRMTRGDLVTGNPDGTFSGGEAGALLLVDVNVMAGEPARNPRRIGSDDLIGSGIKGISGIRVVHRSPERVVLRLGPPPGARWAIRGMRGFALFSGKILLIDGDEPRMAAEGSVVTLANPSATLYLQAGNDSAVGLAFAEPGVSVGLG